eukprot:4348733-Pleurochrysis_carterae.AAC.1
MAHAASPDDSQTTCMASGSAPCQIGARRSPPYGDHPCRAPVLALRLCTHMFSKAMMFSACDYMPSRNACCARPTRPRLQFWPLPSPFCASPAPF